MTRGDLEAGLDRLAAVDRRLGDRAWSLDPSRGRATPLVALVRGLAAEDPRRAPEVVAAFAHGVARVAEAILENFPENVFWDLDRPVAALWDGPAAVGLGPLEAAVARVVELQGLFGRGTPIRFRYAHDFLLGYDWARWVRRAPGDRVGIGPFDQAFLDRMKRRGGELLSLIEADDRKYHRLRGAGHRNPFGFSREPGDEARLLRDLVARDLVPVRAWTRGDPPRWDRPFAELRAERARALGLA